MCEAGAAIAVMGNHEFNAIGWAAQHSTKNEHQHAEFLRQIGANSSRHGEAIGWFRSLPVWLELPGLRASPRLLARTIACRAIAVPGRAGLFHRRGNSRELSCRTKSKACPVTPQIVEKFTCTPGSPGGPNERTSRIPRQPFRGNSTRVSELVETRISFRQDLARPRSRLMCKMVSTR
jgi:hypothetical protein